MVRYLGNGKGLTILAILLAIVGIALAGYQYIKEFIIPSSEATSLDNVWYNENRDYYYPNATYHAIPDLHIIMNVETGQNIYILFDSQAVLRDSGSYESLQVVIYNNGVAISASWTQVADQRSGGGVIRHSLTLQYSIDSLTTGSYNITIAASTGISTGYLIGNRIEDCSLLIMTYN